MEVYLLMFSRFVDGVAKDVAIIGVFSSVANAERAMNVLKPEAFRQADGGFTISAYQLDPDIRTGGWVPYRRAT